MLAELDVCWEAPARMGMKSLSKGGASNAFSTSAKVRGSSLFVHLVLVLVVEIVIRDM